MAANPAGGVYIDYMLARVPAKPVELAVYAANKALVRRYSSADAPPKIDLAKAETAPEWAAQPTLLATTPGMHRFVWPLRYPGLDKEDGTKTDGVWAPPGQYSVELTVDGKSYRQPLTVTPDPRIDLPASAYSDQFALAKRIEALQIRVEAANAEAGALRDTVGDRRKSATAEVAPALDVFAEKLAAISGVRWASNPHNVWSFPPQRVQTIAFLSQSLGALMAAVDDADAAPSPDAQAGYTKLAVLCDATLHAWGDFTRVEVPALNASLKASHEKPVELKPAT